MIIDDKRDKVTLNGEDLKFIRHFVRSYYKNLEEGEIDVANHDAAAVLLYFSGLLGMDKR